MNKRIAVLLTLTVAALAAAPNIHDKPKPAITSDPAPGEPLAVTMGQRKPARVRVARNQTTLIRLPEGTRVMNVYGGDKGEGGVWSLDAGKVPTRFLAIKPKEKGIHTTLHVISNTGAEISLYVEEVTGKDETFDAEVDANANTETASAAEEVKWVPADEATTCKAHESGLALDLAQLTRNSQTALADAAAKAQRAADAHVMEYQAAYPRKLFFGYTWDAAKAKKLGLDAAWSDDKFTYFRGDKVLSLYEVNEEGKPSLIQYTYADGVYTVPKILYDGYFAIGTKKNNKLTFHRDRVRS